MAYPEPRNLDDIYGPGAENADAGIDDDYLNDGPVACDRCGRYFPESALAGDGLCGDCSLDIYGDAGEDNQC